MRESATRLLFSDRSERVALQLALLITNIARFDFPGIATSQAQAGMSWLVAPSHLFLGGNWCPDVSRCTWPCY